MKILINALSARNGGGQTYILNLLKHVPSQRDVEIVVYAPDSLLFEGSARIRRLRAPRCSENPVARAVWERFALPWVLRRESVDVLFCPGGLVNTPVPNGCKVVTMFRNMIPFDLRVRRAVRGVLPKVRNCLLEREMLRSMEAAALTIFISDWARGVIEARITLKAAVTIPHGIGEDFRSCADDLPRPTTVPPGAYILYVSRFDVYKHHLEVVTAYANLPDHLREKYRFVLIGEADTAQAENVRRLIESRGLKGRVLLLGAFPYRGLPAVYRHSSLTVFASSCENCPNILLEALGAGRAVICSNVAPMPEFGGDAVAYFDPFDVDDISRVLRNVLESDGSLESLGCAAAERALRFSWTESARATWSNLVAVGSS
jgi:glycosyltransferase involved in cell wall biosynthesis